MPDRSFSCCFIAVVCVLLLSLSLCPPVAAGTDSLLLTSGEWPPFYSKNLSHGGLGNQIITESFALEGIDVVYEYLPWKRALSMARIGPAIGSAGWLRTTERDRDFLFSDPLFESERVFFYRKERPFYWTTLSDVKNLRVGVSLGSLDDYPLNAIMRSGKGALEVATDYVSGMRMLVAGRIDVYACNLTVGLYELKHSIPADDASAIVYHPRPLFMETNHLILSRRVKGTQELMDRFNRGLRQLKASGRYNTILENALPDGLPQ